MIKFSSYRAIAIGTSAGGIEALDFLLPHIHETNKYSFFIVQHIRSDSDSYFIQYLSHKCRIAIEEARNTEEIRPDIIYFAPPDYHLLIEKNYTMSLSAEDKINFSRPSIDVLFETAAEVYYNRLTGIVLTGANDDGSRGLKRIKELGGKTIVQQPSEAVYPQMPSAALKTHQPDEVWTLHEIAEFLKNL